MVRFLLNLNAFLFQGSNATMFEVFVLEFGCHVNDKGSCYAIQQSGVLDDLQVSFVRFICY